MRFRLGEILKPTQFEVQVGAMDLELGFHFLAKMEPTRLSLEVTPTGAAHRVEGSFGYAAEVPCSRCLETVTLKGSVEFMQEYRPLKKSRVPGGEIEVTPEDDFLVTYEDDAVDAEDLVRQQLYLELPEKPLCTEACKGLCPLCGANLNESPCGCDPLDGDPAAGAR